MYNIVIGGRRTNDEKYEIKLKGLLHKSITVRRPLDMELQDFYWDCLFPLMRGV